MTDRTAGPRLRRRKKLGSALIAAGALSLTATLAGPAWAGGEEAADGVGLGGPGQG